jgi:hypothetical protein
MFLLKAPSMITLAKYWSQCHFLLRAASHYITGRDIVSAKKRQSRKEIRPLRYNNKHHLLLLGVGCAIVWRTFSPKPKALVPSQRPPSLVRMAKVHLCVLLMMRGKEKEKYWSHNWSSDEWNTRWSQMVRTCIWSWVSIFAWPQLLA